MLAEYTTADGYRILAFETGFLDYGLEILRPDGSEAYYSPCALSVESYGRKPHPRYDGEWDLAERAAFEGDPDAFILWDESDWLECLASEANDFIEGYCS